MTTTEVHRFGTPLEAAQLLRRHRRTVYRDIKAGLLPAKKFGGRWLVDLAELERQLEEADSERE